MPRIFDNIEAGLQPALQDTLRISDRADFCVGYLNLRGWRGLDEAVDAWAGGEGHCCRLLVGMQRPPQDELRALFRSRPEEMDNATVARFKEKLARELRDQLTIGAPTSADEAGLRRLAAQLLGQKVVVKLYLRHTLHAKLYLMFRQDPVNPIIGYLGSSNLTLAGLCSQGELNVDVLDSDATQKLASWFEDRWNDRWCIDITQALITIIRESWAREVPIPPYHIYVKMAYHLSNEAREGVREFAIPAVFGNILLEHQVAAVQIAAHHLHKRRGVLIGDVVGLGKTLMATAIARIFEDAFGKEALILCPKNLEAMWLAHREQYGLRGTVMSVSVAARDLPNLRRYGLVVIDESHNLRNREGKTYRAIRDYIDKCQADCVLLTATPYNKSYHDLSNQLRLFVDERVNLGIRPEKYLRTEGEAKLAHDQVAPYSIAAFERSEYPDDWRELMRLYMVRRTRGFIVRNYAVRDPDNGRDYVLLGDGTRSYFPTRVARTARFDEDGSYRALYADDVVDLINGLVLPRYGLGNYQVDRPDPQPTALETKALQDLSRAGSRLKGFCRTNLFKRLESSGYAFILSVRRHILRNYVYLHAIGKGLPLPIGTQAPELLDTSTTDEDSDGTSAGVLQWEDGSNNGDSGESEDGVANRLWTEEDYRLRAAEVYASYSDRHQGKFRWLGSRLFAPSLAAALRRDARDLLKVMAKCATWDPDGDRKLAALHKLLTSTLSGEKVVVFTQFADTVDYLAEALKKRGVDRLAGVTGSNSNPTEIAWRFSPVSNDKRQRVAPNQELRVIIATDVLSEGQNLQDAHIVVNYDLPWAIVRLIQRAGRVDRIGQQAAEIMCYSFLPAEGVEKIIRLRARVKERLKQNAEVVGTDEAFFEDEGGQTLVELYDEKAGILDGDAEGEVDLASQAYQIWQNALQVDPSLAVTIPALPDVVYSARAHRPSAQSPEGVLVYMQTGAGNDALVRIDQDGNSVTESQYEVLRAAECAPDTPAVEKLAQHHELVAHALDMVANQESVGTGGRLGRTTGARYRTYERMKSYIDKIENTLSGATPEADELRKAVEEVYNLPLTQSATDTINSHLRVGIADEALADLVVNLRRENRLTIPPDNTEARDPRIVCSLGLVG